MRSVLRFLNVAEYDVAEIVMHLSAESSAVARKFQEGLQSTGELLLDMPRIGNIRSFDHPALTNIRVMPVRNFERYLIFYRTLDGTVEIVRILHGARDYPTLFNH